MRAAKKTHPRRLKALNPITLVLDDVRLILKKSHCYFDDEATALLIQWLMFPRTILAGQIRGRKMENLPISIVKGKIAVGVELLNAVRFAAMFATVPGELIEALPKVQKCLEDFTRRPQKAVETEIAISSEVARIMKKVPEDYFWTTKAEKLAGDLTSNCKVPISPKVIEKARRSIRQKISPKT